MKCTECPLFSEMFDSRYINTEYSVKFITKLIITINCEDRNLSLPDSFVVLYKICNCSRHEIQNATCGIKTKYVNNIDIVIFSNLS